jgi:hypothetical protein
MARGRLSVFLGAILLAEISLSIRVDSSYAPQAQHALSETESAHPYRKIFASYSHKDREIVEQIEHYAQVAGDVYMRDVTQLRSGEDWQQWMKRRIYEADIFQLFWSSNSMRSQNVRKEWEFALSLRRPHFIRPTYWETPLPENPAENLPPEELRRLHFQNIRPLSSTHFPPAVKSPSVMPSSPPSSSFREEADMRSVIEEERARRRAEEEETQRRLDEEKARRIEQEERRRAEEEERQRLAEEERRRVEEEAARLREEQERVEAEARREAEEAERRRLAEEARRRAEAEAEAEQQRAEEEARRRAEVERLKAEQERQRAEAQRREQERREQEERDRIAREELQREEEFRLRAQQEAREKAEAEARRKAEEEARRKAAEEEALRRAEEEELLRHRAEQEAQAARMRAEAEARERLRVEQETARRRAEDERLRAEMETLRVPEAERPRLDSADEPAREAPTAMYEQGQPIASPSNDYWATIPANQIYPNQSAGYDEVDYQATMRGQELASAAPPHVSAMPPTLGYQQPQSFSVSQPTKSSTSPLLLIIVLILLALVGFVGTYIILRLMHVIR